MITTDANRRAARAGKSEAARNDVALRPPNDAVTPPGDPPVNPIVEHLKPPPEPDRGAAIPLLYAALALAHAGGDDRDRIVGVIYALAALQHICS